MENHRANRLLAAMDPEDFARLEPHLEVIDLPLGKVLYEPGRAEVQGRADRVLRRVSHTMTLIDRQIVLAKAFRGELVPQDPNDEPASVQLERIRCDLLEPNFSDHWHRAETQDYFIAFHGDVTIGRVRQGRSGT